MQYSEGKDIKMFREVIAEGDLQYKKGGRERGNAWQNFATISIFLKVLW